MFIVRLYKCEDKEVGKDVKEEEVVWLEVGCYIYSRIKEIKVMEDVEIKRKKGVSTKNVT